MTRRLLLLAALLLAACTDKAPPSERGSTSTTEATTTTVEATTTTEMVITTAPPTTAGRPAPTAPRTTVAEPELCPVLPHPAHHQPCPPEAPAPVVTSPPAPEPCGRALVGVRAVGLPAGWAFHCGTEIMVRQVGRTHAGLAGWNTSEGNFIAINPRTGDHPGVGAHEACHAVDFVTTGSTSETRADACAAAHGHPNPFAGQLEGDTVTGESRTERVEEWLVLAVLAGALVLIVALLTLLPALRRGLTHYHQRKDRP